MAKYTLLELVQSILSSMDSEEVNNISDTVESRQVVEIIKTTYNDLASKIDFPEHFDFFELEASGDNAKPVLMTRPTDVKSIVWIKYNCIADDETVQNHKTIQYKHLDDFLDSMYMLDDTESDVGSFNLAVGTATIPIIYKNDAAPTYWTTVNEDTILFDSYDSDVDTTLQKNKTVCFGKKSNTFTESNTFVIDLDEEHFNLLLQEAKALAHYELRQMPHEKAERSARQQKIASQRNKLGVPAYIAQLDYLPNYGRRRP